MKKTRKKHSATFKAQVAIEAIKEQETLGELAKRFGLHPQMISKWKQEFLSRGSEIFSTKAPDEEAAKRPKRVRRLLRKMRIMAIYPRRNLSKRGATKYVLPYKLRGLEITHSNHVWCIDITYVPMEHGFMYLTAIIDVYSRYIVGWDISNTLDAENSLNVLRRAIAEHGKPEIINSDQGSQFTCAGWTEYLEKQGITISMDGRGRCLDNIYIERFWRTIKQEYIYLNPAEDGRMLRQGIKVFIAYYNNKRTHQSLGRMTPESWYEYAA